MLYDLMELTNVHMEFGHTPIHIMATDEDVAHILKIGLPYAIVDAYENSYGMFRDMKGNLLAKDNIPEDIMETGYYLDDSEHELVHITVKDLLFNLQSYSMIRSYLLHNIDDDHTPKKMKPDVFYAMVNIKDLCKEEAGEIIEMSF